MWLAITGGISLISGWHLLADRFKSSVPIEGETFRFRSAAMGWRFFPANYGGCLFSTVGPQGFSLSLLFMFRFLHPPVVIPWSAVERCEMVRSWFVQNVSVRINGFDRRLLIGGSLGRTIFENWQQSRKLVGNDV